MYRWFRDIHLFLAVLAFPFVLMYCVSTIRMVHRSWFSDKIHWSEREVEVGTFDAESGRALAQVLLRQHGLRGELGQRLQRQTLAFDWKSSVRECSIKLSTHGRREGLGYGLVLQTSCRCWQEFTISRAFVMRQAFPTFGEYLL